MNLAAKIAGVMVLTLAPTFADNLPVEGFVTGVFSSPSSGSVILGGSTWVYQTGALGAVSTLTFAGAINQFLIGGNTPLNNIALGTLTDVNVAVGRTAQTVDATLTVDVNFNFPTPTTASLAGTVDVDEGVRLNPDSVLDLSNFENATASFVFGGNIYTVHLDGFFDNFLSGESGSPIDSFDIDEPGTHTVTLYGDITAAPEPGSIVLLASVTGLAAFAFRKRRTLAVATGE